MLEKSIGKKVLSVFCLPCFIFHLIIIITLKKTPNLQVKYQKANTLFCAIHTHLDINDGFVDCQCPWNEDWNPDITHLIIFVVSTLFVYALEVMVFLS